MPHILMRFFTVPTAQDARKSVIWAMAIIGGFYVLTLFLGMGAAMNVGAAKITAIDAGGNMAGPLLAQYVGGGADSMLGNLFLAFVAAVAFATIVAVVAGLVLAAASAMAHDLYVGVIREDHVTPQEQVRAARIATVIVGAMAITIGILAKGQNVAHLVALAFAVASSANFPCVLLTLFWKRCNTGGIVLGMIVGTLTAIGLVLVSPNMTYPLAVKAAQEKIVDDARRRTLREAQRRPGGGDRSRRRRTSSRRRSPSRRRRRRAAEAKIKEIGSDRTSIMGLEKPLFELRNPGLISIPLGLPRRDPRLAAVPRQARRGHVGRALRAPEHRPPAREGRRALIAAQLTQTQGPPPARGGFCLRGCAVPRLRHGTMRRYARRRPCRRRSPPRRCEFLRRHAPFNRMSEAALRVRSSRSSRSSHFAKDATILVGPERAGRAPAHRPARAGRQPPQQHAGRSRPHARPRRAVPGRRAVRRRHDDQGLPRAAGHVLLPAGARRLPRAAAGVAGVRALLHAGDHRDAEAVAGEPVQPVQPARGRAADADAHARRARAPSAGRLPRDGDAARGGADDGRRQGAHDHRRSTPTARRSGCSRWSTCCGASCCPERPLDDAASPR